MASPSTTELNAIAGSSVSSNSNPQMCEVPLTDENVLDDLDETLDKESPSVRHSKSDSLRRLFKFSQRKKDEEKDDKATEGGTESEGSGGSPKPKTKDRHWQDSMRRFSLGFSNSSKLGGTDSQMKVDSAPNSPESSPLKDSKSTTKTLKASISNYWNSVFKRPGQAKEPDSAASMSSVELDDIQSDESPAMENVAHMHSDVNKIEKEIEMEDEKNKENYKDDNEDVTKITEEVHTLSIANDSIEKTNE